MLKHICVAMVRAYQRLAPDVIRDRCRFEPSCSNYALLALEKHSLGAALILIAKRLSRCRYPNEGVDYP